MNETYLSQQTIFDKEKEDILKEKEESITAIKEENANLNETIKEMQNGIDDLLAK